jgi:hypothetical protein
VVQCYVMWCGVVWDILERSEEEVWQAPVTVRKGKDRSKHTGCCPDAAAQEQ